MSVGRAVLLVGSAKPSGTSTSESLARYLGTKLESARVAVEIVPVVSTQTGTGAATLAAAVARADLFVLVSPLYVDCLPYLVTHALESLAARRRDLVLERPCAYAAILNCGFPEAGQCRTAIDIARTFARVAKFAWAGGLSLGEGGVLGGKPLADAGPLLRHVRSALDEAARALADGWPIPDTAVAQMARPIVPPALYTMLGDFGWKRQARRNGVRRQLDAKPFED